MGSILGREPVALLAALRAIIICAVSFGFTLTTEQMTALFVTIEAILALVTRQVVTPMAAPRDAEGQPAVLVAKDDLPHQGRMA